METNLEKSKRLIKDNAAIQGITLPDDAFIFKMLELAATKDEIPGMTDFIFKGLKQELEQIEIQKLKNKIGKQSILEKILGKLRTGKVEWEYGTCDGSPARRHKANKNVQFILWKAGEEGHKEDFWHNLDSSYWNSFVLESTVFCGTYSVHDNISCPKCGLHHVDKGEYTKAIYAQDVGTFGSHLKDILSVINLKYLQDTIIVLETERDSLRSEYYEKKRNSRYSNNEKESKKLLDEAKRALLRSEEVSAAIEILKKQ